MTDGIVVRPARWEEADQVAALCNAINSLDGKPPIVTMTAAIVRRDLLGDTPRALLRLAVSDGAVMGFATACVIYDAVRAADALMLLELFVERAARRRGAARALMAALAEEARR